jgi:hypothetical protein
MHFVAIGLSFAHLFWTAQAVRGAKATLYKSTDCTGDAEVVFVDVSTDYCFPFRGHSFKNFELGDDGLQGSLITWSGSNCQGSSSKYHTWANAGPSACVTIPYAGVELKVQYYDGHL